MKLSRRRWLELALCAGLLASPLAPVARSQQVVTDLKTTLEKGLRARRPAEFEFLARVVDFVEAGKLPRSLVMSTFLWARKKPDTRKVVYFQQALKTRAAKIGVTDL